MTEPVIHFPFLDFDIIPPGVDLVAEVRTLNEAGVEIPWAWVLSRKPLNRENQPQGALTFGVHNDVGVLEWAVEMDGYVPATGTESTWSDYFLAGLDETSIPPHAEVPVETVYAAVAEFLVTGQRPTCVEWQEAASLLSRFE